MTNHPQSQSVKLDLNNPEFQRNLLELDKTERNRVLDTLKKLLKLDWSQLYRDPGLKWEKITSVRPPKGVGAIYSLRITQARRATALRDGDYVRFLTIQPDHDSTYGTK
jgi:mRNA-degrading endonuclease RelE of RelBE toxin-antitoxin system